MATIQVKNVPEAVHAKLRRRSALAGQSLQEYLLARLVEQASRPSLDEVLSRAGSRAGGSAPFARPRARPPERAALRKPATPLWPRLWARRS